MEVETLMKKSGCSTVRAASVATVMKRIGGSEAASMLIEESKIRSLQLGNQMSKRMSKQD